jgi:hypothetical protein
MSNEMVLAKANYVKRGKVGNQKIKATIRYIEHRPGKEGAKITRTLFNRDGACSRINAYTMIDSAEKGSVFFRFVLSPDPKLEDTQKDLNLWEITDKTMQSLEERLQKQVHYVAAEHNDTNSRHVHVVLVVKDKLFTQDFKALAQKATEQALFQRKERDKAREQERRQERKGAEWERQR